MKGTILHTSSESTVIRGENEQKFEVTPDKFSSLINPNVGDEVDFDIIDGTAHNVYVLRSVATIEEGLSKARVIVENLYSQAINSVNEENLRKVKKMASTTVGKAKESLNYIELSKTNGALKSINLPRLISFKVHNKFSSFVLITLFISMILPLAQIFNESQSYLQLVENTGFQLLFITLTLFSLLLGLPRFVSRILALIFLITLSVPIYDAFSYFDDMRGYASSFSLDKDMLKMLLDTMRIGLPLLLISSVLFAILQLLPWYQTNEKFLANNEQ
ncbi:conserved membrane protein of unknown function [Shewanella benthica]|uniref:Uncharacterized protein n=1 Tax=Shewanella benthica TaxID=43661 RepID=A0A330M6R7_9GAMM|nr:hypothetical protein [Shewanella benthica]SQH77828.1 conserved membrane protein of unknown function [Shewanella benthica]